MQNFSGLTRKFTELLQFEFITLVLRISVITLKVGANVNEFHIFLNLHFEIIF